jgi:beta-phosphoglucomutase-like phosphatase (HAD superfamily)
MRLQGAIFDVDGVLVDSLHSRASREALREPRVAGALAEGRLGQRTGVPQR